MVTIGMNYDVISGKEKVFEDAFANVLEAMKTMEGHGESSLYRKVGADEPAYLIVSQWSDEQAFADFVASEKFRKVTQWGAENILRGRPRHTTYRHDEER